MIVDLSWPKGHSVNDGVSNNAYLGTSFSLHYPSVDSIIQTLNQSGPGASIFKVDISSAFQHVPIDPGDTPKYRFKNRFKYRFKYRFNYRFNL